MKKRGQVTIFIIIGIVIVSAIALFLLLRSGFEIPGIGIGKETSPSSFLESCMEDKIKETIEIISSQGGYVTPSLYKSFKFEDENSPTDISYLCYTQNSYIQCINQEPMLIQHLQNETKNYISDDVGDCFDSFASSLEKQGYVPNVKYEGFEVELMKKKIIINLKADITLTKAGETTNQEDFKIIIPSRFYDLIVVVQEIINKEATNCDFSHYDMFRYPEFNIYSHRTADSSVIYTVKHRESKEEFKFAVRGCVMPPGFGMEFE